MTSPSSIVQLEPIAAIATAVGENAIAVVRMSGDGVFTIADKTFTKSHVKTFSFAEGHSHTAHHGRIVKPLGNMVDDVIAIMYRSPNSYTGEDSVEINCHGGVLVTEEVLRTLLDAGCRLATPGEFTKRAFINGKIDLTQAEAVGELIHAKTNAAYRSAITHLKGDMSKKLQRLRSELLRGCALLELEFDFSEEDVLFQSREELLSITNSFIAELEQLISSFRFSKAIKEGIKITLLGKPNAGKSTLLNALVGFDRSIVSHEAGTTRDFLQEHLYYQGTLFQIVDTAGIRESYNLIEKEGVKRSFEQGEESDIIVYLFEISDSKSIPEFQNTLDDLITRFPCAIVLPVRNKIDLNNDLDMTIHPDIINISAEKKLNLDKLLSKLKNIADHSFTTNDQSLMITNLRHYEALKNALTALNNAKTLLDNEQNLELVASSFRSALYDIGTITGDVSNDEILNYIFEKFCIGK